MTTSAFDPCDCRDADRFVSANVTCASVLPGVYDVLCIESFTCPGNFRCRNFRCQDSFDSADCEGFFTMNYAGICPTAPDPFNCSHKFSCSATAESQFSCGIFHCEGGDQSQYACHKDYTCQAPPPSVDFQCNTVQFGCSDTNACRAVFHCNGQVVCGNGETGDSFECTSVSFTKPSPCDNSCEESNRFACLGEFEWT